MEQFYRYHLQDGLAIPEALRQSQLWLRDVTAGELAERFGEEKQYLLQQTRLPSDIVVSANRRFSRDFEPEDRPFAHSYYWAAFTFTGS